MHTRTPPPTLAPTLATCALWLLASTASAQTAQPPSTGAAPAPAPTAAQRLHTIEQQLLPAAQRAVQQQARQCNTQRAVLHARQAMASGEAALGSSNSLWHDLEVLTTQCESAAQPLRAAVQQLQTEQAQLQQTIQADKASAPTAAAQPAAKP